MRGDPEREALKLTLRDVPSAAEGLFAEVWTDLERASEYTFSADIRRHIERLYIDFVDRGTRDLRADAGRAAVRRRFASYAARQLLFMAAQKPRPQPPVKVPKARGRPPVRQREREKNEKLLSFVAERVLPFRQLLEGRLKPGRLGRQGVPWEALHRRWNRTQDYWIMSWEALKVEYYAAARNPHLARAFLGQVKSEVDEEWREEQSAFDQIRAYYAGLPDAERARLLADGKAGMEEWMTSPEAHAMEAEDEKDRQELRRLRAQLRASFGSDEEYQQWRAKSDGRREEEYRASLTRRDLIAERVMGLVWRPPDQNPRKEQEEQELWRTPLRPWFIPEARGARMRLHRWSWHRRARESGGGQ